MIEHEKQVLNYKHISSNIEEAIEQLQKIQEVCKTGDYDVGEFLVDIQHALYHLHFSFNGKFLSDKELESLSDEEWEKLRQPPDIF